MGKRHADSSRNERESHVSIRVVVLCYWPGLTSGTSTRFAGFKTQYSYALDTFDDKEIWGLQHVRPKPISYYGRDSCSLQMLDEYVATVEGFNSNGVDRLEWQSVENQSMRFYLRVPMFFLHQARGERPAAARWLHPWVRAAHARSRSYRANPNRPKVRAIEGGSVRDIAVCKKKKLEHGDVVGLVFTVAYIETPSSWSPLYMLTDIIRVMSANRDLYPLPEPEGAGGTQPDDGELSILGPGLCEFFELVGCLLVRMLMSSLGTDPAETTSPVTSGEPGASVCTYSRSRCQFSIAAVAGMPLPLGDGVSRTTSVVRNVSPALDQPTQSSVVPVAALSEHLRAEKPGEHIYRNCSNAYLHARVGSHSMAQPSKGQDLPPNAVEHETLAQSADQGLRNASGDALPAVRETSGSDEPDDGSVSSATDATTDYGGPSGSRLLQDIEHDQEHVQVASASLLEDSARSPVHGHKADARTGTRGRRTSGYKTRR